MENARAQAGPGEEAMAGLSVEEMMQLTGLSQYAVYKRLRLLIRILGVAEHTPEKKWGVALSGDPTRVPAYRLRPGVDAAQLATLLQDNDLQGVKKMVSALNGHNP
jgi:hypothetical protein